MASVLLPIEMCVCFCVCVCACAHLACTKLTIKLAIGQCYAGPEDLYKCGVHKSMQARSTLSTTTCTPLGVH